MLRESNRRFDIAMLTRFVFGFVLDKTRLGEPATEESPLFLAKIGDYSLPELALSLPKWSLAALCVSAGQGVPLARMTNSISPRLSVVLPGLQNNEKKVAFCCRIKRSDFI